MLTFPDGHYLGRYQGIYAPPRSILSSAGARVSEMEKSGAESFCCGAGGGRILAEERIGTRINETRVAMAQEIDAKLMVSNCPFCLTMFEDGIKTGGSEGRGFVTIQDGQKNDEKRGEFLLSKKFRPSRSFLLLV